MGTSVLKAAGLYTSPNQLSSLPEGALTVADNVVIRTPNVIEPRNSQAKYPIPSTATATDRLDQIGFFNGSVLVNTAQNGLSISGSQFAGTFTSPALQRMRFVEAQENLYFNTTTGTQYLETINSTPAEAGFRRAWDLTSVASNGAGGAWMSVDSKVGYRVVWGRKDTRGRIILSEPSGRTYFSNAAGGAMVSAKALMPLPTWQDNTMFYRLYRTAMSAGAGIFPSDEYYLVKEDSGITATTKTIPIGTMTRPVANTVEVAYTAHTFKPGTVFTLTSAEGLFAAGSFTVTSVPTPNTFRYIDTTTVFTGSSSTIPHTITPTAQYIYDFAQEGTIGDPLYTNPRTGDGDLSANAQPPVCQDMCLFQNRLWFANTVSRHRFTLEVIGVGTPEGVQDGDTITIAGLTYTARLAPTLVTDFAISTALASVSLNIQQTARNLVLAIQANPSNTTVDAFYVTAQSDTAVKILIQERAIGGAAFTVYASRQGSWAPYLTNVSSGAIRSQNDATPNRIYFSKFSQPEAVPLLDYIQVGAKNNAIQRIVPLRDRLFVFKQNEGVYVVSGLAPDLRVDLLDGTVQIIGPDTAVVLNNQIFVFTAQGVVTVTAAGVTLISAPIENDLRALMPYAGYSPKTAFAVAHETERSYILFLGESYFGTYATVQYVFNYVTRVWTRWTLARTCGAVSKFDAGVLNTQNALFTGDATSNYYFLERPYYTTESVRNYDDRITSAFSVTAVSGADVTLNATTGITPGDVLYVSSTVAGVVVSVAGNVVTLAPYATGLVAGSGFTVAANVTHYKSIQQTVEYAPLIMGAPDTAKQFSTCTLHFDRLNVQASTATYRTELSATPSTPSVTSASYDVTLAAPTRELVNKRMGVPMEKQRATALRVGYTIKQAGSTWTLNGFTLESTGTSDRNSR